MYSKPMERRTTIPAATTGPLAGGLGRLPQRISRGWRVIATAIGFGIAGPISLFLALIVFPLLRIAPGSREQSEIRAQYALHLAFRSFLALLARLGVLRVRCNGVEALQKPGILVVANHPTLIDALIVMSFMAQADCVVKPDHYDNFWLSSAVKGAGYIPGRNGPQMVESCVERLRSGRSLLIFPEGTRSPKGELGILGRGAAHIALHAGCDLIPVTIDCQPATLYHGLAWWNVPERRFTVTLTVGAPLSIESAVPEPTNRPRAARAITVALRDHFERRLSLDRNPFTSG